MREHGWYLLKRKSDGVGLSARWDGGVWTFSTNVGSPNDRTFQRTEAEAMEAYTIEGKLDLNDT